MKGYGEAGFDHAGRVVCGECSAQVDNAGKCKCGVLLPLRVAVAMPVGMPAAVGRPEAYGEATRTLKRAPTECELLSEEVKPEYGDTIKFCIWGFA